MATFSLTLALEPIAQPRTRSGPGSGKKKGKTVHYVPKAHPVHAYKETVALKAKEALMARAEAWDKEGPMGARLTFCLACPKGLPMEETSPWASGKPDLDNLVKAVLDAIKGSLLVDDCQVVRLESTKTYASLLDEPFVAIQIEHLALLPA